VNFDQDPCDPSEVRDCFIIFDAFADHPEALEMAVETALVMLTPPDELALREHFGLRADPTLEDVASGDWREALKRFPPAALALLRGFV
jgi:hypothetical protein